MAGAVSNFDEIEASIRRVAKCLQWDRKTNRGRVGDLAFDLILDAIHDRTINEQMDANGKPLAPLKPGTISRKRKLGRSMRILESTGEMLSFKELRGRRVLGPNLAIQDYGQSSDAKEKAEWAHEGSRKKPRRRKRPFYSIPEEAIPMLDDLLDWVVEDAIRQEGGD